MLPPREDQADRRPVWDALQMFWMDTDPEIFLRSAADVCARSKYSLEEIEAIFWSEVRPAVKFNLWSPAGEWTGFDLDWLTERILEKHHFGRRPALRVLDREAESWWEKLRAGIEQLRANQPSPPPPRCED